MQSYIYGFDGGIKLPLLAQQNISIEKESYLQFSVVAFDKKIGCMSQYYLPCGYGLWFSIIAIAFFFLIFSLFLSPIHEYDNNFLLGFIGGTWYRVGFGREKNVKIRKQDMLIFSIYKWRLSLTQCVIFKILFICPQFPVVCYNYCWLLTHIIFEPLISNKQKKNYLYIFPITS